MLFHDLGMVSDLLRVIYKHLSNRNYYVALEERILSAFI